MRRAQDVAEDAGGPSRPSRRPPSRSRPASPRSPRGWRSARTTTRVWPGPRRRHERRSVKAATMRGLPAASGPRVPRQPSETICRSSPSRSSSTILHQQRRRSTRRAQSSARRSAGCREAADSAGHGRPLRYCLKCALLAVFRDRSWPAAGDTRIGVCGAKAHSRVVDFERVRPRVAYELPVQRTSCASSLRGRIHGWCPHVLSSTILAHGQRQPCAAARSGSARRFVDAFLNEFVAALVASCLRRQAAPRRPTRLVGEAVAGSSRVGTSIISKSRRTGARCRCRSRCWPHPSPVALRSRCKRRELVQLPESSASCYEQTRKRRVFLRTMRESDQPPEFLICTENGQRVVPGSRTAIWSGATIKPYRALCHGSSPLTYLLRSCCSSVFSRACAEFHTGSTSRRPNRSRAPDGAHSRRSPEPS